MQHKFAPDAAEAIEFYAGIDEQIGHLLARGAVVGITADHGMNAKQKPDGSPNVIYLESELIQEFGSGFRVILPITDPYVAHHGALGSFAQVHLPAANLLSLGSGNCFPPPIAGRERSAGAGLRGAMEWSFRKTAWATLWSVPNATSCWDGRRNGTT
jgi:hypothetical protein